MKKTALLVIAAFVLNINMQAQDTITIMTYNILNYPNTVSTRYNDLKEIVSYVKPDVFICSELTSNTGADLLLNNSFNSGSVNYYSRAGFVDGPDTDNMLYYNTTKVGLASQNQIATDLRDISHYKIFLCGGMDTVWIDLFSLHLKASSGSANASDRLTECTTLCSYLSGLPQGSNIIVGGDFNFYGAAYSTEPGFTKLTATCGENLYDPIATIGEWHANVAYKNVHTQSPRSSTNPGCCGGSTGGMDDRFDFFFINDDVKNGSNQVKYLPGSYYALGNDGNHYNKSIIEAPTNTSVPSNVVDALFNMSDHLPVVMKLIYSCDGSLSVEQENVVATGMSVHFSGEAVLLDIKLPQSEMIKLELINMAGSVIHTSGVYADAGDNTLSVYTGFLSKGMYTVRVSGSFGYAVRKFVK